MQDSAARALGLMGDSCIGNRYASCGKHGLPTFGQRNHLV